MEEKQQRTSSFNTPYPIPYTPRPAERGLTTLLVIAFMGIFLLIMGTITSYSFEQAKYGRALLGREQALHVAEGGLEYYRWFLAHNPGNLQNGTGGAGPYAYAVKDPETSATIGTASLSITGNTQCAQIQSVDITSTGSATANPAFKRTLMARYMRTSLAAYSYVLNASVWAGSSLAVTGNYFSNGGIRMDATNNSYVQSARSTWDCTSSYGCSPQQSSAPGVVGSGSGSALWQYPATSIDFPGMSTNLASLKTYAQNNGGLYFAPASGTVSQRGYHVIFNSDGTVTVKRVSATVGIPSFSSTHGWALPGYDSFGYPAEYSVITTETSGTTYAIPPSCSLIFVDDRAWIEGTVKGKVTVVVATPSDSSTVPDAYLINNILYATNDGTTGLTVIAEGGVLIPLTVPATMTIHGIFVALGGAFERPSYTANSSNGCPYDVNCVSSSYSQYTSRTSLTVEGSIVSNLRTGTQWVNGSGNFVSGFQNRITSYDQLQATNPPPFTPSASTNYGFVLWKEQ
jgi:hypothetical protein